MVVLISHRGNLKGPNKEMENKPEYIQTALEKGFYVEVDVWKFGKSNIYLGHDEPQYEVGLEFLKSDPHIICHAKNVMALKYLLKHGIHCFGHDKDDYVLTSRGFIWTYPSRNLTTQSICVLPEWEEGGIQKCSELWCYGICSDFVEQIKTIIN